MHPGNGGVEIDREKETDSRKKKTDNDSNSFLSYLVVNLYVLLYEGKIKNSL